MLAFSGRVCAGSSLGILCSGSSSEAALLMLKVSGSQPAKNLRTSHSKSPVSLALFPLSAFGINFGILSMIDGWSINSANDSVPFLSVFEYVHTLSPLPRNLLPFQSTFIFSWKSRSYGGNHIILPPFGPICSFVMLLSLCATSFQARFSIENMQFLMSTLLVPRLLGAILTYPFLPNTVLLANAAEPPIFPSPTLYGFPA